VLATILLIHSVTAPGALAGVNLATQVGRPWNADAIAQDVRALWNSGRFHDIRVETIERPEGADVIFHTVPEPQYALREIRLKPNPFGIQVSMPPGAMLTRANAHDLARTARRQLIERGYANAQVDWQFTPAAHSRYDLLLSVTPGEPLRIRASGDTSLHPPKVYTADAINDYAARLTSHYIALGYYDTQVAVTQEIKGKDALVHFEVARGAFHRAIDTRTLCACLFRQRRDAERRGILEFSASLDASGVPAVQLGQPYTVGRISFFGHTHYSDSAIRRNFVLDESAPLDGLLLRRSLARINRAGMFEIVDQRQMQIQDTVRPGVADITIHLTERKRGGWNFAGPLPLSASIGAHLPAWGQGLLELSSYTVSFNLLAYSSILKLTTARRFLPLLALERPFTPGGGWLSGFAFAPQIPAKLAGANYLFTQFDRRVQPLLAGQRGPDLTVTFQRPAGEAALICEAPRPRFAAVRAGAGIALHVVRSFAAF
jgi:outer membrane protein assembly factor BamA